MLSFINQLGSVGYYFISFSIIISIIIFVHEYGHYIVAKICQVKVEFFSIGFGPEIFGFNDKSGTRWKLSAIPLGGYVKMLGDTNEASVATSIIEEEKLYSFYAQARYKKAAIVFAGPLANIIFTFMALTIFFCFEGYYRTPPIIGNVIKDSPAEKVGLLPGDVILKVNNHSIKYFEDISRMVISNSKIKMEIEYKRNNDRAKVVLIPSVVRGQDAFGNIIERESIGITSINIERMKQSSFIGSLGLAIQETYHNMGITIKVIGQMLTGKRNINEIGGPIKIAKYSGQSAKKGFTTTLYFMAIISINLAMMNLLPIPLLDGGHLFHYMIEALIRRDLNLKYQKYAAILGAFILFSLTGIAILNDIKYIIFTKI